MPGSLGRSAARRPPARGRRRWLLGSLALLTVAAAIWAFSSVFGARGGPPLDDIDAASRERLDAVLREAEREERTP